MVCSKSLALFPLECPIILLKTAINPALAFSLENWTNPVPSTSPHLPYFQAPPHFSGCPWTCSSLSKAGFSLEAPNWKQFCKCQGQGKQLCSQPLVDVHMSTAQPLLYFCRGLFYYSALLFSSAEINEISPAIEAWAISPACWGASHQEHCSAVNPPLCMFPVYQLDICHYLARAAVSPFISIVIKIFTSISIVHEYYRKLPKFQLVIKVCLH